MAATASPSKRNFILQQGLDDPGAERCPLAYSALHFQPRVIGVIALIGIVLQSPWLFLALGVVLVWNVLVPALNPFDLLYNATLGSRAGAVKLTPAEAPRRFAQSMAAAFTLGIGASLYYQAMTAAYVLEGFLLVALGALTIGRFCLGSWIFHLVRGRVDFATRTLPWKS